jgi:hypothetical protein
MPRDDNGVYTPARSWIADAAAKVPFSPQKWDEQDQDFAAALNDLPLKSWTPRMWPPGTDPSDEDVNPGSTMWEDGILYCCAEVEEGLKIWIDISSPGSAFGGDGSGDMVASVYDPQDIGGDAFARANHTGAQAISTVTGLQTALDGKAPLNSPALTGTPTVPTAANGTNTTQAASTAFVQAAVALLINSAPGLLDTLDEIAAALNDDPDFAGTMTTALAGKQPIDSDLTAIAALTPTNDDLIQRKGGAWVNRTMTQLIADLAALGTTFQPLDGDLTAIAALSPSNDDVIQRKSGAWTNRTMAQLVADIAAAGAALREPGVVTDATTSKTLALTDAGKIVEMTSGSANDVVIPANASVAFPVGTIINIVQQGAGTTTIDADTGVTLNGVSGGEGAISARYGGVSIYKRATNEWVMSGAHGAVA